MTVDPKYAFLESRNVYSCLHQTLARILTSLQAKKSFFLRFLYWITDFDTFAAPCKRQNYVHTFWLGLFRCGYFPNELAKSFEIWVGGTKFNPLSHNFKKMSSAMVEGAKIGHIEGVTRVWHPRWGCGHNFDAWNVDSFLRSQWPDCNQIRYEWSTLIV